MMMMMTTSVPTWSLPKCRCDPGTDIYRQRSAALGLPGAQDDDGWVLGTWLGHVGIASQAHVSFMPVPIWAKVAMSSPSPY
eukprot:1838470-Karenia_brevis.AAC.1